MPKFRDDCLDITLVDLDRRCPEVHLRNVGLDNFGYLTFFIVKDWVYIFMRLDFDCNPLFNPLDLLLVIGLVCFFLELFI